MGLKPPDVDPDPPVVLLGDLPVFGDMFEKSKYIKLFTILGMEYDLWINPVPTMFFVGDYILPISQGVVQSVCLAEDKGHRQSKWSRDSAQISEDADLAENKGMYTKPKAPNIILFNKWVLPFGNPFFKPDYENLNEDVPEREPLYQRHDPNRVSAPLDPDDAEYKDTVKITPSYTITYNRDPDLLEDNNTAAQPVSQPES